ncbi:MAG TPA: DPP IV N-terminal domain-containing protein, partial [Anaerolineales bacterium]|nr:DPP IV N-terminal domain-containing protein [Anaerolineales bacterium]
MLKTFSRVFALTAILCLVLLAFPGCSPKATPTSETRISLEQPTATEKFIPVVSKNAEEAVIVAFEEDGYAHLFAYIPEKMPLTRITSGDWDDITPSASPDGKKIAFASNRNGFWDLYFLDLGTGEVTQLTNTPQYEGAPTWSPDGSFMAFESY